MSPDKENGQSFAVPIISFSCFLAVFFVAVDSEHLTQRASNMVSATLPSGLCLQPKPNAQGPTWTGHMDGQTNESLCADIEELQETLLENGEDIFANNESEEENVDGSVMEKSSTKKSRKRKQRQSVFPDQDLPSTKSPKDDDDDDVSDNKGSNNVNGSADTVGVWRNGAHCADMGSSKGNKEGNRGHSGANDYQSEQRNNNKGGKGGKKNGRNQNGDDYSLTHMLYN